MGLPVPVFQVYWQVGPYCPWNSLFCNVAAWRCVRPPTTWASRHDDSSRESYTAGEGMCYILGSHRKITWAPLCCRVEWTSFFSPHIRFLYPQNSHIPPESLAWVRSTHQQWPSSWNRYTTLILHLIAKSGWTCQAPSYMWYFFQSSWHSFITSVLFGASYPSTRCVNIAELQMEMWWVSIVLEIPHSLIHTEKQNCCETKKN